MSEFHVESKTTKSKGKIQILDVFSNVCKESIVSGEEQSLLRHMQQNLATGWSHIFDPIIYLPIEHREIYEFEIVIRSDDGSIPSFLKGPVRLTLLFKRYPFYAGDEAI